MQRQEAEQDLNQRLQRAQAEKQAQTERINAMQRNIAQLEQDKREVERSVTRMEKDRGALKKTLDKVFTAFSSDWSVGLNIKTSPCLCNRRATATNNVVL